jgi:NADH-quinone oxidoreductase subunit H
VLIKIVGVFAQLVGMTLFTIVFERKVVARMQQRIGPNRVGPRGYLQSLADGLKLAFKEDIMPALADKPVYFLAPVLATVPAFLAFSVIPLGPVVSIFGQQTPLQLTDAPIGVLIVLACSAMGIYGIVLGGWASGLHLPAAGLAAQRRADDQLRDRDGAVDRRGVPLRRLDVHLGDRRGAGRRQPGLLLRLEFTGPGWFAVLLPVSFVIYVIAVVGETNRRRSTCPRPRASWSAASTPSTRR